MAQVRYQVDGVHENAWAHAFFPTPPLTPDGTFSLRRFIHSSLGTVRVPSPRPAGAFRASPSPEWHGPSDVAPDWFAPQVSWSDIDELRLGGPHSGCGVHYMPHRVAQIVPPIIPQGTLGPLGPSAIAMSGRKVGGRRSMHWLRSVIAWPGLGATEQPR